jgi:transcriptional regulator with XRE-family HTH domain
VSPHRDRPDRALASSARAARRRAALPGDDLERRVRARLRALRHERMLTLAEAAQRAGMDPSAWSRLESGARRLTFAHLPPLARALGVSAEELLARAVGDRAGLLLDRPAGEGAEELRASPAAPAPATPRSWKSADGSTYVPLGPFAPDAPRTCRVLLPSELRTPVPCVHAGHQWLHVLCGRLRLTLGDERQVLAPGEAAQFSTWTPHASTVVDEPVELLVTFDPEGSRHG